jgi:CheY-like chemotaxis protein
MKKRVLIIEDNPGVRENTAEILELAGYEAVLAEDGKKGVDLAVKENPDLILCDIMMPGLDGYGVLHILSQRVETAGIPFIFLTAKTEKNDVRYGMSLGADDYITKPFEETDLLRTIENRLRKAEALRQTTQRNAQSQSAQVTMQSHVRHYSRKDSIYHEGDPSMYVYKVLKGTVRLYCYNSDGKEYTSDLIGAEGYFGYVSSMQSKPREENAEALQDCELELYPADEFIRYITSDSQMMVSFVKMLSNNIAEKEKDLLKLAYDTVRKRVAEALVKLFETVTETDNRFGIAVSRELLASMAGTSTESAIRVLSGFKSDGLIEINGSHIKIVQVDKLRSLRW